MGYWDSADGERHRSRYRQWSSLRFALEMEGISKEVRRGTRVKAREAIRRELTESLEHSMYRSVRWPKPRAAVALDVAVYSASGRAPRVDKICKWLLDELEGLVYANDRQIKLLFVSKVDQRPPQATDDSIFGLSALRASRAPKPVIYANARTRADVLAALRRARDLDDPWDPLHTYPNPMAEDPDDAALRAEMLRDFRASLPAEDDEARQITQELAYRRQAGVLRAADEMIAALVSGYLTDRDGLWAWLPTALKANPYVFDFGAIPGHGESSKYEQRVIETIAQRIASRQDLFPLRVHVGITVMLFERDTNKDLDNLVMTVLPTVLDQLSPPLNDHFWYRDVESEPGERTSEVKFIEAIAVDPTGTKIPSGTVLVALSSGWRHKSWWANAEDYVERRDDLR